MKAQCVKRSTLLGKENRKRQSESECVALERMRVVCLLQASASVSNEPYQPTVGACPPTNFYFGCRDAHLTPFPLARCVSRTADDNYLLNGDNNRTDKLNVFSELRSRRCDFT
ncbi:hypothetical protein EVAR_10403_1 [Eumeta japonica]|uniref:Uncharacterized protein n=1 Tax=Eumeta variegata TaxID=151549 RepID=A0A4C1UCU3_EUMVA|nr:hypothetical protein EVAR_10403_1 [Eumeta japonica]